MSFFVDSPHSVKISRGTNVPLLASALTQLLPKAKWISPISKWLISFPDLLWTKPKARSGKVRKFVFLDWLLHLTPVFRGKLSSNSSSSLEISAVCENEKQIRKDERRKDLEVICHSGLNNFCNMIVPLPKSQRRHPARAKAPISHTCLYKRLPLFAFFCTYEVAQSPHENSMWGANTRSVLAIFGNNY